MKTINISIMVLSLFLLVACGQNKKTKNNSSEVEIEQEHKGISLSDKQMKAVNIQIGTVEKRNLSSIVRANGEMALEPQKKANVNSLVGGIIKQILVIEGKYVKSGQIVAFLENTEIVELQKKYLTTKKEALIAEQEYHRQKELSEQGAGVEKVRQQAAANFEILKAQSAGLEQQLRQLSIQPEQVSAGSMVTQIPIKSPISGNVNKINISIGSYVDIQNPLMSISDNSQIHCKLNIFEKDINKIKIGQEVDINLTNQEGTSLKGLIYQINKSFQDDTKAVIVHVNIKDKKGLNLFEGMYASALINIGEQKTDAVPDEAIVSIEGKKYIFLLENETNEKTYNFERLEVITGVTELGYTQIIPVSNLDDDAKIVTSGAFYIASMLSGSEEE